jgi:hypothetical protein
MALAAGAYEESRLSQVVTETALVDDPVIDIALLSELPYGPRMIGQVLIRAAWDSPGKIGRDIKNVKLLVAELDEVSTKLDAVISAIDNSEEA